MSGLDRITINNLIESEYAQSMGSYPYANLPHGALGVIEEEVQEAEMDFFKLKSKLQMLKHEVHQAKGYPHLMNKQEVELLDKMSIDVVHCIEELIQVGAMVKKYKAGFKESEVK